MRATRVCFLIDRLSRAGTETQLLALIRSFDRSRVEPFLVLLDGEGDASRALEPIGCEVLRLGVRSFLSRQAASAARAFGRFLRSREIDVLQAYFLDSVYFGVPVARLAGVRKVIRVRNNTGYWLTRKHRLLGKGFSRLCDITLTNSEQGRDALLGEGVPSDRVVVLENGVDVDRFAAGPLPNALRVGAVANLRPVKNLDLLIRAVARLAPRYPRLALEIAGDGEQRPELERLIAELNCGERIRLIGAVGDIPGFLASLDVAVLCSRSEGMSNALLEYMAAGRAIVATRVGANDRLIRDQVEGLLVPAEDEGALAGAIERLLIDPALAARLAAAARRRAVESFSRAAMCRRFENFYERLVVSNASR
jgi:glycosyltransferase involved in cell wall biosynthesis